MVHMGSPLLWEPLGSNATICYFVYNLSGPAHPTNSEADDLQFHPPISRLHAPSPLQPHLCSALLSAFFPVSQTNITRATQNATVSVNQPPEGT